MDSWDPPGTPHTHLCSLLYSNEYTFGLHMFMVLLYATVNNSDVWPNKYVLFLYCIGVSSVLVTSDYCTFTVEHCVEL